jgi:hypothetical protein
LHSPPLFCSSLPLSLWRILWHHRPALICSESGAPMQPEGVAYLCYICASPRSTASTHSYKMKYQEYKGLYYNAWSTNNIVLLQLKRHNATNLLQL